MPNLLYFSRKHGIECHVTCAQTKGSWDMDPVENPYTPGAGAPPHELVGREKVLDNVRVAIQRSKSGKWTRSFMLVGLRGVGKTVLLREMIDMVDKERIVSCSFEASTGKAFLTRIIVALQKALRNLSRNAESSEQVGRSLRILKSFAKIARIKYGDIEFSLNFGDEEEPGVADSGVLEEDLVDLFIAAGEAAKACHSAIFIFIDEIQNLSRNEFEALIMSIHQTDQRKLPIVTACAGLPSLIGLSRQAKTYAERLFEYVDIGPLDEEEAFRALVAPAADLNVEFKEAAALTVIQRTKGYPYFLQVWGYEIWNITEKSPITIDHIDMASKAVAERLDKGFFRSRFERLSNPQKEYLIAMAKLGRGPHKASDIAATVNKDIRGIDAIREELMDRSIIYSPKHNMIGFTVPLFDGFIKREIN